MSKKVYFIKSSAFFVAILLVGFSFISYLVANAAEGDPEVLSITLLNDNPTQDQELVFEVTFSEEVSGFDGSDLHIATTGSISGQSLVSIEPTDLVAGSVGETVYNGSGLDDAVFSGEFNSMAAGCSIILGIDSLSPGNGLDNDTFIYGFQPGQGECDINDVPVGDFESVEITPSMAQYLGGGVYATFESGTGHALLIMEDPVENAWSADLIAGSGGAVYHVTIDRGTGFGTVGLDFIDNDSVVDVDGNPIGGIGENNGDFTDGEIYTIPMMVGAGTSEDPYQVTDCEQLQSMQDELDAHYRLQNNIDCSGAVNWNEGEGFSPIGNQDNNFNGTLDGNGHTISNLYIARNKNHQGMFGILGASANISNMTLSDFDVTAVGNAGYHVGTLAGISYGTIVQITVQDSTVTGDGPVGGLLGSMFDGNLSRIYVQGVEVVSLGSNIGGAIGYIFTEGEYNTIENMYVSDTTVSGDYYVGGAIGLAGINNSNIHGYEANMLLVTDSYAQTNVSASAGAGGFIGLLVKGTIQRSYSAGVLTGGSESNVLGGFVGLVVLGGVVQDSFSVVTVTGGDIVGGFVGLVGQRGMLPPGGGYIHRVYSTGSVAGDTNVGGLVGLEENNDGEITYSYWNIDTSGQTTSSAGFGKTDAAMQNITTFVTWDITGLDEDFESPYPLLWTEESSESTWIMKVSESAQEPTPTRRSSGSSTSQSRALAQQVFADHYANKGETTTETPSLCPVDQIITQNLRAPSRNGVYNSYTGGIVLEINILQTHLNRLGFNSGPVDGIAGPLTDGAIKRMQTVLGTPADGYVGPLTRALLNTSCSSQGLQTN